MQDKTNEEIIDLTSGEIGYLWETYQYESLALQGVTFFLEHVDDKSIQQLLERAQVLSEDRIQQTKEILIDEGYAIPQGFTEKDVNVKAPRLFSDIMYHEYLLHTLQIELVFYSSAMLAATKLNIQEFFQEAIKQTMQLEMEAKELAKEKGIFQRAPKVPKYETSEYVKNESFLATGWFGEKRPLLAIEIAGLVFNAKRNALGEAVITAFSQVANTKEIRKYFEKGKEISRKHVEVFTEFLHNENLSNATSLLTAEVTESTVSPFSDKLMMNFTATLVASGLGQYGSALAMSPRRDLGVMYTRLMGEIAKYANEGAEILIQNSWMEQPPMAADREKLIKKENK